MPCYRIQNRYRLKGAIVRFTNVRRATSTGSRFTSGASRELSRKFWRVRIMNPFKGIMRISAITILFGLLALSLGWLSIVADLVSMLQLRQIAIVLLVLFFYSLTMDKIEELEEKIRIVASSRKKPAKLVP